MLNLMLYSKELIEEKIVSLVQLRFLTTWETMVYTLLQRLIATTLSSSLIQMRMENSTTLISYKSFYLVTIHN